MSSLDPPEDATRLLALSDGVFGFAVTLLVVDVELPPPGADAIRTVTPTEVFGLWPEVFSYVISFLVIASFWVDHRHLFRLTERHDDRVTWINILFLMCIAFIPFPTSVLGEYGGRFPVTFYAASMALTGLVMSWLWWSIVRRDLLASNVESDLVTYNNLRFLAQPVVFGLSIPASFVSADAAFLLWGVLPFVVPLLRRVLDV